MVCTAQGARRRRSSCGCLPLGSRRSSGACRCGGCSRCCACRRWLRSSLRCCASCGAWQLGDGQRVASLEPQGCHGGSPARRESERARWKAGPHLQGRMKSTKGA